MLEIFYYIRSVQCGKKKGLCNGKPLCTLCKTSWQLTNFLFIFFSFQLLLLSKTSLKERLENTRRILRFLAKAGKNKTKWKFKLVIRWFTAPLNWCFTYIQPGERRNHSQDTGSNLLLLRYLNFWSYVLTNYYVVTY